MIAGCIYCSGCSAVWLARLTGGQKVGGSNPLSPIEKGRVSATKHGLFFGHRDASRRLFEIAGESVGTSRANDMRTSPNGADVSDVLHETWCGKANRHIAASSPAADQDVDAPGALVILVPTMMNHLVI